MTIKLHYYSQSIRYRRQLLIIINVITVNLHIFVSRKLYIFVGYATVAMTGGLWPREFLIMDFSLFNFLQKVACFPPNHEMNASIHLLINKKKNDERLFFFYYFYNGAWLNVLIGRQKLFSWFSDWLLNHRRRDFSFSDLFKQDATTPHPTIYAYTSYAN